MNNCEWYIIDENKDGTIYDCPNCNRGRTPRLKGFTHRACKNNKNDKDNKEKIVTQQKKDCKFKSHLLTLPCNIQRGNLLYFCEKHKKIVSLKPITERAKRFILERKTCDLPEGTCEDCVETTGCIDEDGIRIFTETEIDNIEVNIQNGKV